MRSLIAVVITIAGVVALLALADSVIEFLCSYYIW
jgi:hypothetical protein